MAASAARAVLWTLALLPCLVGAAAGSERHGLPARHITVRRQQRAGPLLLKVAEEGPAGRGEYAFQGHSGHARARRSLDAGTAAPIVNVSHLNDSHQQVMIQWTGEGSPVIICLMRDALQNISRYSSMFISEDYGSTYKNISHKFQLDNGQQAIISTFYNNKVFHSRFVFTDVLSNYIFVSKDRGQTIVPHQVFFTPSEVMFHPTDAEVLLIHDTEDPERKLWISEDFGENWKVIEQFVKSFFASEITSPPTLYIERGKDTESSSVLASQELFRAGTTISSIIDSTLEFEVKDEFLFAVKRTPYEDTLSLLISYRGGTFHRAVFPNSMKHEHYYIADVSEGQIMVCVAHEEYLSNLYVSSVPRSPDHPVQFSLSLERIVFFKPSPAWEDTWLSEVAEKQFADLHPVKGIRGVFIASQLAANMTTNAGRRMRNLAPEHTMSFISFDQGAQWKPLQPPQKDASGNIIDCKRTKNCSLHVGQSLSHLYPSSEMTPILSKESAPGMILATGTIGTSLKDHHTSLYVSVDAGISWFQVLRGNFLYAIGDHGGIIVAAQHYREAGEINTLFYSTDEGESWHTYQFFNESLRIYGLMTEPGENTTIFTLFGSRPEKHQWIFVKVDLRPVFKYKCSPDDYKLWSPSDGRSGRLCLLGRKQEYERRISHSNCYSGVNYDRPVSVKNCPCDRDDFECDFGFFVDSQSQKCIKDKDDTIDPYAIPSTCKPGGFYNRTKGYRIIPGNTCEGGRDYQYNPTITACPVQEEQAFLLVAARQAILRFDLTNPDAGMQALPIPHLNLVIALDFDLANNCIFWSDVSDKKIYRLCFDGHHDVETLVENNLRSVEGLAFDWVSKNLYFVDGDLKTLEVIRTDISNFGRMRRTLLSSDTLDNPRGIALHPYKGFLYITDWSESKPQVARAYLDGKNFTTLFGAGVVGWPNGITIDFQEERIYFADAKLDYIASADLDGHNLRKIISNSDKLLQPFAVGIYKSTVYWDDWTVEQVMQADKVFGWGISPIANFTRSGLVDLKVYGHWSQNGNNSCSNQTKDCNFLCMGRPNNEYSCLCPDGLQKKSRISRTREECGCPDGSSIDDNGTCKSLNNTCSPGFFKCNNDKCIPDKWVCDKDNDCGDGSDENSPKCGTLPCYPPYWQCKNGQCITPSYRCDHHADCNDSSDEEGCDYEPCSNTTFQCDNGKCIHSQWRCDLEDDCRDGSDEKNCTVKPESGCKSTEFMCSNKQCIPASWQCDGDKDCTDNSDESKCQSFTCTSWQFACLSSRNKCIFRNWQCDGENDCDDGSDEFNCTTTTTTPPPSSTAKECDYGSDENCSTTTTTSSPEKECSELMFMCDNGHCVPFWWRCDELDDCGDASDEAGCPTHGFHGNITTQRPETSTIAFTCLKDQFQCSTGTCIWETWVCDNDYDCPGKEDEENCPKKTCAALSEYQCRHSSGCIPSTLLCNGHNDCADGSDEEGCSSGAATPNNSCPSGYMMCDGGACQPLFKICDGTHDCMDLSDEQNCTTEEKAYAVTDYLVNITDVSLVVEWIVNGQTPAPDNLEYLLSYTRQTTPGNSVVWKNVTWTTNTSYELKDLSPYTYYVVKVYIREKNGDKIFPPFHSRIVRSPQGVPSPPEDVRVESEMDVVRVTWKPPSTPAGVIKTYHVFVTPPKPPRDIQISGTLHEVTIPQSDLSQDVTIWVTMENDKHISPRSNEVQYSISHVDYKVKVKVDNRTSSTVTLSWDAVKGVDGYIISHDRPENKYLTGNVTTNTSESSTQVLGLAPGLTYTFWVRSYEGRNLGPETTVRVITRGNKLLPVESLQVVVTKEGTTAKLSWTEPPYKTQKVSWTYRIIWGKSANDLKHSAHIATTPNTTFMIRGLDACETYHVAVMVGEPIGIGPMVEKSIHTDANPKAPPKNLQAKLKNLTMMTIAWEVSCPQGGIDREQYMLFVTETTYNVTSSYQLLGHKNRFQSHVIRVDWGGRYSIRMRTAVTDSILTEPVICNGPDIPPPYELTYEFNNGSFFWRNSPSLPKEISSRNYTYILRLSRNMDMTDSETHECSKPPLLVDTLAAGIIYYAAVALKDSNGYLSLWSQTIRLEKPIDNELVISQGSAVGVGVSVFLVVVALIVVVGILVVRHRRLARSLIAFTNTHYDSSQGTTLITTDHNLDEDDDSPMIRGFSDDEPLVIA